MPLQDKPVGNATPPVGGKPVALSERDAERAHRATQYFETLRRNPITRDTGYRGAILPLRLARVTTTITARSANVMGSGQIRFADLSGSTASDSTPTGVACLNSFDQAVNSGANAWVLVGWAEDTWWVVVPATC